MAFQSHLQSTPPHWENSYRITDYTMEEITVSLSTAAKHQGKPVAYQGIHIHPINWEQIQSLPQRRKPISSGVRVKSSCHKFTTKQDDLEQGSEGKIIIIIWNKFAFFLANKHFTLLEPCYVPGLYYVFVKLVFMLHFTQFMFINNHHNHFIWDR